MIEMKFSVKEILDECQNIVYEKIQNRKEEIALKILHEKALRCSSELENALIEAFTRYDYEPTIEFLKTKEPFTVKIAINARMANFTEPDSFDKEEFKQRILDAWRQYREEVEKDIVLKLYYKMFKYIKMRQETLKEQRKILAYEMLEHIQKIAMIEVIQDILREQNKELADLLKNIFITEVKQNEKISIS